MKASVARKHGWRPIVSEAQATALMRRELKRLRNEAQRDVVRMVKAEKWYSEWSARKAVYSYDTLLCIRVGSWYKFTPDFHGRPRLRLLRCNVVDDAKSPVSQSE